MTQLDDAYTYCERIARRSGSNFYRSFSLLRDDRRNAMVSLYAFARLADDATDQNSNQSWNELDWHHWVDHLLDQNGVVIELENDLDLIRPALVESVRRFSIPTSTLHDIVTGVGMDTRGPVRFANWESTKTYCQRVASSVGTACVSIWSDPIGTTRSPETLKAADDCGVAFQLTNILRDIVEDTANNRIYLPLAELARFQVSEERWFAVRPSVNVFSLNEIGDWRGLIRLQVERAKAHFASGWRVHDSISLDGQRMFSLIWQTYRELLSRIDRDPLSIWQQRARVPIRTKLKLFVKHALTPLLTAEIKSPSMNRSRQEALPMSGKRDFDWSVASPSVAVVGAGLAGINAALHLARHGCNVTLFESKHRIGGRVGSFLDVQSGQWVDYCQHVGMRCCDALKQWISDTDQQPFWTEQSALHFVSVNGKKVRVSAWPLPAPLHLMGLLMRWPDLNWSDRIRISQGLYRLLQLKMDSTNNQTLTIDWLRQCGQTDRCIKNFWATILVSALGEQLDRVTLGATRKVLVDGFAADRRSFHLLVPTRSLSSLMNDNVLSSLKGLGVSVKCGIAIQKIQTRHDGTLTLNPSSGSETNPVFDAVVCAVPWNKLTTLMPESLADRLANSHGLQSSPITGIHTWWDRPWLKQPHAILIDRVCQWVFPAPIPDFEGYEGAGAREHYYQIVISGSRDLPHGDSEAILKMVKQDLSEVFPEAAVATLMRGRVVTDPNAVFSVSPGHAAGRFPGDALAAEGIWLAGDWTETNWPATMEGALRSGLTAAEMVLQRFQRPAILKE
ncbi:MAG: hydroxysqualene dehydroxylase HpnE [Pirellula sp.]